MNRLQHETSPYLLQHAHNPVDWYAWKPEAFERAKREDKPIIVSIGYSTCHWCHVMERESFEDADTAAFMNEHFINIKVDREERPDVDHVYMEACQAINGNGGWPLNCFLLPDGRPYYAGTYYPPQPAYNRPSWLQLLGNLYRAYRDRRPEVVEQAEQLMESIQEGGAVFSEENLLTQSDELIFNPTLPQDIHFGLTQRFDTTYGGFGGAPKFPGSMSLQFLLDYHHYDAAAAATGHEHLHRSLEKMIGGGIYDQIGGGFSRYTVDSAWLVPHFEKMLYDNALLVQLMANAYRTTAQPVYARAIRETLTFVERELMNAEGGFYSALDADSEGEEGKFYVWSEHEIDKILGDDSAIFKAVYGVSAGGNWEGKNILWQARSVAEVAKKYELEEAELVQQLSKNRKWLWKIRAERVRPGLDDKSLLHWNALMISAYVAAYHALGETHYRETALRAIAFVREQMYTGDGRVFHTYKDGQVQYPGFLDDYAFWIRALLDAYTLDFDLTFIDEAQTFTELVLAQFLDRHDNLFYFTAVDQTDLPARRKEVYDNALPSGNAVMVENLRQLGVLKGKSEWQDLAQQMVKPLTESLRKYPTAFGRWSQSALRMAYPGREVVFVGPEAETMAKQWLRSYHPQAMVMAHSTGDVSGYPLLEGRAATTETLIYVCENYACQLPVRTLAEVEV
ncbi:MAG: thioredoxin domain-containing protein [Bacteroidota bacterium]